MSIGPRDTHPLLALLVLALAGCGADASDRGLGVQGKIGEQSAAVDAVQREEGLMVGAPEAPPAQLRAEAAAIASKVAPPAQFALQNIDPTAMIIRTGTARVEVDSLELAVSAVRALAARSGGHIANTFMQGGDDRVREATLELKVPAARFDDALAALQPLGEVESVEVSAQDVGEEYVDVAARIENARRLEERLLVLLDTRTGKLTDVLAVERELARVREEIERLEGRLRFLKARTSLSTLAITVHESAPLLSSPGQNVMLQSVVQAWRNFVGVFAGLIALMGIILPVVAIGVGVVWGGRRIWRGWRRPRALTV